MSLNYLDASEMAALTLGWVEEQRPLFLSIPVIAGMMPEVEAAHALVVTVNTTALVEARSAELSAQLSVLDPQHDDVLRAIDRGLASASAWSRARAVPDHGRAEALTTLRSWVLPEGLSWTRAAYREEVGHALRVMSRLSAEQRALAASVSVEGVTVLEMIQRWEAVGRAMNGLLRQQGNLADVSAVDLSGARRAWLRAVGMVLGALESSTTAPPEARLLSQPVLEAAAAAQLRAESRAPAASPDAAQATTAELGEEVPATEAPAEALEVDEALAVAATPTHPTNGAAHGASAS